MNKLIAAGFLTAVLLGCVSCTDPGTRQNASTKPATIGTTPAVATATTPQTPGS